MHTQTHQSIAKEKHQYYSIPNCKNYSIYDQGRRQVKICWVDRHGERRARAYNGGLEVDWPPYLPL